MSRRRKPNSRRPKPKVPGIGWDLLGDGLTRDAMLHTLPDGTRAAFVAPVVPDDAPAEVREGIARRRLVYSEGRCPCGAVLTIPKGMKPGGAYISQVEHSDDCPASDPALTAAMSRWEGKP